MRVQRPSYNPVIKSISTMSNIEAGDVIPVDLVIKNVGYSDLDDLYVTASISALGLEKTSYFGDLVATECCDEDDDNKRKRNNKINNTYEKKWHLPVFNNDVIEL